MLNITFSLMHEEETLSGYELGNIEIKCNNVVISSSDDCRYLFMVFISMSILLDEFSNFCADKKSKEELHFIFVDSSFYLNFKKNRDSFIIPKWK